MAYTVVVAFGGTQEYTFELHDAEVLAMSREQARAWLAQEFEALECTPSNPMGKVLALDMILNVAKYGGESRFRSLQVGVSQESFGESIQRNLSWAGYDRALPPEMIPHKLFDRVFGKHDEGWIARKRSVLDVIRAPAGMLPVTLEPPYVAGLSVPYDPTFSLTKTLWDFGDGTTSKELRAEHTFKSAGRYPITLTVRDKKDHSTTRTFYAVVE